MGEASEHVRPLVAIIIAAIAKECNRDPDDFTQGLHHMLAKFGEECFSRGVEYAHDRPTLETPVLDEKEDLTPVRPVTLPLGITREKE